MKKSLHIWKSKDNKKITCDEKIKVLNENINEIQIVLQNAFDDGILIGCDESDLKEKFSKLIKQLNFSFKK